MKVSGYWAPDGGTTDISLEVELRSSEERDLFAAFALAGLLARPIGETDEGPVEDCTAVNAYYYADQMLKARDAK